MDDEVSVSDSEKDRMIKGFPKMLDLIELREIFWVNDRYEKFQCVSSRFELSEEDIADAKERLLRFAPYLKKAFPETEEDDGIIESPIVEIPNMKIAIEEYFSTEIRGKVYLKCDNILKISGSIKARGGIYEVLKHAEDLALKAGLIDIKDNYEKFASDEMKSFFSEYKIEVGSTGNLGLSIGIMGAKLGFQVTVHMSSDARTWKKELLRSLGVEVKEYESDYSKAVEEGRTLSKLNPRSYFVDDENSKNLFLGYAVAAERLDKQLKERGITVDEDHPLFVYLPCGVGGGPGGVAFGLKFLYKDNVHFFFAEPTHSPCMTIGCMTKTHDKYCVQDFGIDNLTSADGLAVGRASGFVGKTLENLISGCYTLKDETMHILLAMMVDSQKIYLEPSALAGVAGVGKLFTTREGKAYLRDNDLIKKQDNITHIAWATGGGMVPKNIMDEYYKIGKRLPK
ncbi:MAG: D-serine ammonia-lyase [Proteocatella sp.]